MTEKNFQHLDVLKLDCDLRDAYVELLSAQFAMDRVKLRYSPEMVAANGNPFVVLRSISAAEMIAEYLRGVRRYLTQAGTYPQPSDNRNTQR